MKERQSETRETLDRKPLVVGMVGCLASGKTTLAKELGSRWCLSPIEENYPENPYLEKFYENPSEFSFRSQVFFLTSKIEQLQKIDKSQVNLIDPSLTMDFLYAKTHFKMGWMRAHEWNLYQNLYYAFTSKDNLTYPDMHIVVTLGSGTEALNELEERIEERNRPYEKWILKNYPEYLIKLNESVDEWIQSDDSKSCKFIANTSSTNPSGNVERLANRIESHICARFTSNKFVLPDIQPIPNNYYDFFPGGGSESQRFTR